MLTELYIKNFRGLKEITVGPLKRVNLIIGQNNTGKTGLLEALFLLLTDPPNGAANLPNLFRSAGGDLHDNFWKWLFYNKETSRSVEIRGKFDNAKDFGVVLQLNRPHEGDFHSGIIFEGGLLADIPCFTTGGRGSAGVKVSVFSTHPTNPRQDAIDRYRREMNRCFMRT